MNSTLATSPDEHALSAAARALIDYREHRAGSRGRVRAVLDALAAEARRYLGAAFTENDPVTDRPIALVVRSDERLPDDYEQQTPRPLTDTVSRLIVEVLGRSISIEIDDAGMVRAHGEARNVPLDGVTDVRVAAGAGDRPTFLVVGADDPAKRSEIPFARVLADLVDTVAQDEARFGHPTS
jgi:hypothetical protein